MVCGMPSISFSKNEICKGCMLGKNIKKAFSRNDSRAQGILVLVHSNVCGPMSSLSLSGCLYYVIFIHDYPRKCWIYFLKVKSDTFDKFKEYKAFIEKQKRTLEETRAKRKPSDEPLEPVEELERTLEEPRAKRKPGWLKETMQEVEKIVAPKGTFRESKRPHRFGSYVALMSSIGDAEPSSIEEADKLQVWKDAMLEEYRSILKNNVWDIVQRPKDKSMVSSKWIYKIKHAVDGSVEVLVWKLHQMDVKTAFLNGKIEQEVFVEQPDGFVLHNKDTHVCKLRKALYGFNQAPRVWYDKIDGFLKSLGFQKSDADANRYFKVKGNQPIILILYVDDLFLTGDQGIIAWCKRELISKFEMKDLGLMHYFLGLKVWKRQGEIFLAQGKYIVDVLKRFGMIDCKSMSTAMITNLRKLHDSDTGSDLVDPTMYRQLIGSLMYMIHTRPDICYAMIAMSLSMAEPRQRH
jgi:hypothetical protein